MSRPPLYSVAYLDIPEAQRQWIQRFRRQHDPHFSVVEPHFTMVFGVRDVDESVYLGHVAAVAAVSAPIRFECRYAMLGADDMDDTAYVFLVPDLGNAAISRLHDALYRGPLQPFHRLEFPYIPHIGLAACDDFSAAKRLCDELNAQDIHVEGWLRTLTVGVLDDGKLHDRHHYALGG